MKRRLKAFVLFSRISSLGFPVLDHIFPELRAAMLTLGTYRNLMDASLAKLLLDDHDIFCRLFDENAFLWGGAPFAMPVRLVVSDAQFEKAARILAGETVPETEDRQEGLEEFVRSNNPWEILAIAYLFLVPGLGFLLESRWLILVVSRRKWITITLSPLQLHVIGGALILVALLLVVLYFRARREIERDEQAVPAA
jgi:Putative prokaryotic signal transducing protein